MSFSLLVFLCVYFGGLILCFVRHPIYGIYAYLAAFYLHPPSFYWGQSLPDIRWALISAIITFIAIHTKKNTATNQQSKPWFNTFAGRMLSLYALWMIIQYFWAIDTQLHTEGVVLYLKYVLLFYIIYKTLNSTENIKKFIIAHVVGCFYLAWLAHGVHTGGRLEGVGGPGIHDANTFGMFMGTAVLFASMLLFDNNLKVKLTALFALPFIINGLILAGSRGAFLGLVAGGIPLFIYTPKQYRKHFVMLAVIGIVTFFYIANEGFITRLETMLAVADEEVELEASAASRSVIIGAQVDMFKDYPMGGGHKTTLLLSPIYLDSLYLTRAREVSVKGRASHNTIMTSLTDQGIPGGIIYFAISAWCYLTLRRMGKVCTKNGETELMIFCAIVGSALLSIFISGLFSNFLKAEVTIWCIALLAAIEMRVFSQDTTAK